MIGAEIEAARRLLQIMDDHMTLLESEALPFGIPSDNQVMFYVSDNEGFIRIQQHAAFICEWLIVTAVGNVSLQATSRLVGIRDTGPGVVVTLGRQQIQGNTLVNPREVFDSVMVPAVGLVPVSTDTPGTGRIALNNADYIYRNAVEWQLARGTAVKFDSAGMGSNPDFGDFGVPRLILFGHEVYG